VLQDKDTQEKFAALGFDVKPTRSTEEFRKYVADQHAYWGRMVEIARVQLQERSPALRKAGGPYGTDYRRRRRHRSGNRGALLRPGRPGAAGGSRRGSPDAAAGGIACRRAVGACGELCPS
jgi:hypothetical protein